MTAESPTPPSPITPRSRRVGRRAVWVTAPTPVATAQPMRAAWPGRPRVDGDGGLGGDDLVRGQRADPRVAPRPATRPGDAAARRWVPPVSGPARIGAQEALAAQAGGARSAGRGPGQDDEVAHVRVRPPRFADAGADDLHDPRPLVAHHDRRRARPSRRRGRAGRSGRRPRRPFGPGLRRDPADVRGQLLAPRKPPLRAEEDRTPATGASGPLPSPGHAHRSRPQVRADPTNPVAERPLGRPEGDLGPRDRLRARTAGPRAPRGSRPARRRRSGRRRRRRRSPPRGACRGRRSRPARRRGRSPRASRGSAPSWTVSSISMKPPGWAHRPRPGSMPRRRSITSPVSVIGSVVTTRRGLT